MEMTRETRQQAEMLISYFNFVAGTRFKYSADKNMEAAVLAIEKANGDIKALKAYFKEYAKTDNSFTKACYAYKPEPQVQVVEPQPAPAPVVNTESKLDSSLDFMGKVMVEMLAKMKLDDIQSAVVDKAQNDLRKFISDNYGPIQRKVELTVGSKTVNFKGVLHEKFDTVLQLVNADVPVFLTGPAGSGKNVICKQVAEALGLKFYFSNAVTQEYKITGFTDAMGNFQESQFYKAFKNGGVFMLDEMDASIPEVLIILNAAIANRYFDFPAPIGYVEAHPDFRVIAAGNTFGEGADAAYVGRNQLDAASLNRFALIQIDYDSRIEENCANGDNELLKFCRAFRKAVTKAGIGAVVSYRNISMMAKTAPMIGVKEAMKSCLVKALGRDDLNIVGQDVRGCGQYTEAFDEIVRGLR